VKVTVINVVDRSCRLRALRRNSDPAQVRAFSPLAVLGANKRYSRSLSEVHRATMEARATIGQAALRAKEGFPYAGPHLAPRLTFISLQPMHISTTVPPCMRPAALALTSRFCARICSPRLARLARLVVFPLVVIPFWTHTAHLPVQDLICLCQCTPRR
jgi:hypothetical protein